MTKDEFCKLHTQFHGEEIDNVKQLTKQVFTGEELYEFCEFIVKNVPATKQKTFICRFCDAIFTDEYDLLAHVNFNHNQFSGKPKQE